jgi:hypothetical protein
MTQSKKAMVLVGMLLIGGCSTAGSGTDVALMLVSLPFRILGAAVGAAVGVASGMGLTDGVIVADSGK